LLRTGKGDFDEAEKLFYQSLEHARNLTGQEAIVISIALGNIGLVNRDRGDLQTAVEFYRKALAEQRKIFSEPKFETGVLIGSLGNILKDLGRYAEAEANLKHSYEIIAASVGEEHQFTA